MTIESDSASRSQIDENFPDFPRHKLGIVPDRTLKMGYKNSIGYINTILYL